jgi:hypothetical protein
MFLAQKPCEHIAQLRGTPDLLHQLKPIPGPSVVAVSACSSEWQDASFRE